MMNIDITEMKSRELIRILTLYPYGSLETKHERIFWCSDTSEPEVNRQSPGDNPQRRGSPSKPNQGEEWSGRFRKMQDTLGGMMGPAK